MRRWVLCCSLLALAPSTALANCPPRGCPAPRAAPAPVFRQQPVFRPQAPRAGFQQQRSFTPNQAPRQQVRTFGSPSVQQPSGQSPLRFGQTGGAPQGFATGQPRGFGSFGHPQGGPPAGPHFGSTGTGPLGFVRPHGFQSASGGPRRSPSGRQFVYRGQHFARFAGPRYRWPHGYAYHRYAVGYRLPRVYFVHDYFIDDYVDYGLAPPPDDYEWIRYGPDILLVDLDTGEIAQVVYGVFDEVDGPPDEDPDQTSDDGGN
jgi:Ni/Co efflux regulator RcnB